MAGNFGGNDEEVISGINVTPLVDVVLVLLVIFLMTAPVLYQSAIKVQLPQAKTGEDSATKPETLAFTIDSDGKVFYKSEQIAIIDIPSKVGTISETQKTEPVMISADQKTAHGIVVELMDQLRSLGLTRFGLNVDRAK